MATRKDLAGVIVAVCGAVLLFAAMVGVTVLLVQQGTAGLLIALIAWGAVLVVVGVKLLMD